MTAHSILGNTRRADISFWTSGKIDIASRVVRALRMEPGDVIDIMAAGGEYYLYVAARASQLCGRHEAQCFPSKHGSRHFRAYSRRLCSVILRESGATSLAALPAGDLTEVAGRPAIPVITRNNLHHD